MSRNSKATSLFVAGAAIGSIATLLLAPFSGKKMRKITKEKGQNIYGKSKEKYSEVNQKYIKPYGEKIKINEKLDKVKSKVKKGKDKVEDKVEDLGDAVQTKGKAAKESVSKNTTKVRGSIFKKKDTEE